MDRVCRLCGGPLLTRQRRIGPHHQACWQSERQARADRQANLAPVMSLAERVELEYSGALPEDWRDD